MSILKPVEPVIQGRAIPSGCTVVNKEELRALVEAASYSLKNANVEHFRGFCGMKELEKALEQFTGGNDGD